MGRMSEQIEENHHLKDDDTLQLNSIPSLIVFIKCFLLEALYQLNCFYHWSISHVKTYLFILSVVISVYISTQITGPHQEYLRFIEKKLLWSGYWMFLGILSSIGLGTGLHTFILYLGPHIASVTLAAYECNSLDFPEPPYPNEIICPDYDTSKFVVTIFKIASKVRLEAFMWGVGTAIGELPPYFMARTARLSGQKLEEEEEEDQDPAWYHSGKQMIKNVVEKAGFFGILLCASIPNPLFDMAGIACGHFLVPFWTFFGATLIGKAIVKMHLQQLFVIVAFNEHHFENFVDYIKLLPYVGKYLHEPFREFLNAQKTNLHRKAGNRVLIEKPQSWLGWCFEKFVLLMVIYFVWTIVNSMAQEYHKRNLNKKKQN